MSLLSFALRLEESATAELDFLAGDLPAELVPVLKQVQNVQTAFSQLLNTAVLVDESTGNFPEVDHNNIIGRERIWRELTTGFAETLDKDPRSMLRLWMIYALIQRTGEFYGQASFNCGYPSTKLFYSSLAEVKNMLRRRIDALLRVQSNECWGEVGFSPSAFGKE